VPKIPFEIDISTIGASL
jgi:hypothetical protein